MSQMKFIDRMAQGKISRRNALRAAAAFGVGLATMPLRARADSVLTCMEWSGYDKADFFKSYVAKHGKAPNFSIFADENEALQKVRAGYDADIMHPCTYSVGPFVEAKIYKPIDTSKLSNWPDIFPTLKQVQGVVLNGETVMAPADWGNSGIAYRTDLVDADYQKHESWGIFADDKYAGRVAMLDNEVVAEIGGLMLGYSPEKIFADVGRGAGGRPGPSWRRWSRTPASCGRTTTELDQALASGEVVAGYAWNVTVKNLKAKNIPGEIRRCRRKASSPGFAA